MKRRVKYFLSFLLVLFFCFASAQEAKRKESNQTIDSLLNILKIVSSSSPEIKLAKGADTIRINTLNLLSTKFLNTDNYEEALQYSKESQLLAENINYQKGMAFAYTNIGLAHFSLGNYEVALENHLKALKIKEKTEQRKGIAYSYADIGNIYCMKGNFEVALDNYQKSLKISLEINDKKGISISYMNIGSIYEDFGNYEKSLDNYLKSLKIFEETREKSGIAGACLNIGLIYYNLGNFERALENYLRSLKIFEEIGDKKGIAYSYTNMGLIYDKKGNYEKALDCNLKSLKIKEEIGDKRGIAISYNNIGDFYSSQKNYKMALDYYLKSLKINKKIGDESGIAMAYESIGGTYLQKNNLELSYHYLSQALAIYKEIGEKEGILYIYSNLSDLYYKKGDYKKAYSYHKLYSDNKDTLLNEQSSKQIMEMNTKYESEKKEKDILILTKDKDLQQAEIGKQKLIRNGSVGGLVLALSLAFILFNRFKVASKQKKIIGSQNFQIVESINYSKKIQDSLLPDVEMMQKVLPDLFVFYKPKAIVSGDFYWFREFENYTLLACVDCSGHGVLGGFMSTLGSLLLDKIANNEVLSPSQILNKLSDEIIRVLHQQDGGEIQDGMDLSICLINHNNRTIEFSGARNGIIIVNDEQAKRFKGNPLPVGGNCIEKGKPIERNFETQSISINPNDWVYMFTDGFIEQVGGVEGLPMNYAQFENQLISVSKKQNSQDKIKLLQTELDKWRGTHERDDDVLIMGFQVV